MWISLFLLFSSVHFLLHLLIGKLLNGYNNQILVANGPSLPTNKIVFYYIFTNQNLVAEGYKLPTFYLRYSPLPTTMWSLKCNRFFIFFVYRLTLGCKRMEVNKKPRCLPTTGWSLKNFCNQTYWLQMMFTTMGRPIFTFTSDQGLGC